MWATGSPSARSSAFPTATTPRRPSASRRRTPWNTAPELKAVKAACQGRILKVIIETCLLTDEEKIKLCALVSDSGADFIKTSTGFSTAGATFDDIALFKAHVGPGVKIKAAGGISSFEDAEKFIALGANRLGTSRIIKLALQEKNA